MSYGDDRYNEERWDNRFSPCVAAVPGEYTKYDCILENLADETIIVPVQQEKIAIGTSAFLKTMWALFWTAFVHPFTDTAIDMTTGEIIRDFRRS